MPSIMQFLLLLSGDVEGDGTDVADFCEAHLELKLWKRSGVVDVVVVVVVVLVG